MAHFTLSDTEDEGFGGIPLHTAHSSMRDMSNVDLSSPSSHVGMGSLSMGSYADTLVDINAYGSGNDGLMRSHFGPRVPKSQMSQARLCFNMTACTTASLALILPLFYFLIVGGAKTNDDVPIWARFCAPFGFIIFVSCAGLEAWRRA